VTIVGRTVEISRRTVSSDSAKIVVTPFAR
jgi:hypothetical protein